MLASEIRTDGRIRNNQGGYRLTSQAHKPKVELLLADNRRPLFMWERNPIGSPFVVTGDFTVFVDGKPFHTFKKGACLGGTSFKRGAEFLIYAHPDGILFMAPAEDDRSETGAVVVGGYRMTAEGADLWDITERPTADDDALYFEMRDAIFQGRAASNVIALPVQSTTDRMVAFIRRARESEQSIEPIDLKREGFTDQQIKTCWDTAHERANSDAPTDEDTRLEILDIGAKAFAAHASVDGFTLRQIYRDAGLTDEQIDRHGDDLIAHSLAAAGPRFLAELRK